MKFAHISDLHVGKSWMFDPNLLDMAIERVNALDIDGVLITGDLTDWGLRSEYEEARRYLDRIQKDVFIIPGNHDARISGYRIFEDVFCSGRSRFFSKRVDDAIILGLDSSEPDIDDGHVGREQLDWLRSELSGNRNGYLPIIALHHHLVPIPNTGRERNILVDAGDVLEVIDEKKVPLVITGHKHNPWIWSLNDTIIYSGGTVSCKRTATSNAYSILEVGSDRIRVIKVDLPDGKEEVMVDKAP